MRKLGWIATWKIKWYCEDNIGKHTARGIAVLRADTELDSLIRLKSWELMQENNNKESIENKYTQSKEYN